MSNRLCNKCRSWAPLDSGSWCIGCTASDELRGEFQKPWGTPYRRIAHDLVISVTRQIRALRVLSLGVQSQQQSEAAKPAALPAGKTAAPARAVGSESPDHRGALQRKRTTTPKSQAKVPEKSKEEESSYETYTTEEEEQTAEKKSEVPVEQHQPLGAGRRRDPSPGDHCEREATTKKKQKDTRERTPRRKQKQPKEKEHSTRGRRHRPHHRAGRKHKRLYRLLENPSIRVHQRPANSFWELEETFSCNRGRY